MQAQRLRDWQQVLRPASGRSSRWTRRRRGRRRRCHHQSARRAQGGEHDKCYVSHNQLTIFFQTKALAAQRCELAAATEPASATAKVAAEAHRRLYELQRGMDCN